MTEKPARPLVVATVSNDLNFDQRMQRICSSLQKNGHRVLLVGRSKKDTAPLSEQIFEQKRLPCFFEKGPFFYVELNVRLFFFLLFLSKKNDRAIFYAVDLDTIAPVFFAGKMRRARLVYDAHEYFSEVPEVVERPAVKRIWEAVARFFIPKMDAHLTVGPALARMLGERYGVDFQSVRNVSFRNISSVSDEKNADAGKKIMLYQGALNVGRGLEQTIDAMPFLPSDIEFWLAGEGDLSQFLRAKVKKMGLENRVRFLGFVRPVELPDLTKKAWLGLNLLEDRGLSYHFSLANKFFDYIQNGVPSLNMNLPEYSAINSQIEVGILLNELSPKAISEKIILLKNDYFFYKKLSKNCFLAGDIFCWEKEESALLRVFSAI